jgi:hypothetical protein
MPLAAYFRKTIDGRLREASFTATTATEIEELIETLAESTTDDARIYHTERDSPSGNPDHVLTVGIRNQAHGAMSFLDSRLILFFSKGSTPDDEPLYNEREFPPCCEIKKNQIKEALFEFLETAEQPTCIEWKTGEL